MFFLSAVSAVCLTACSSLKKPEKQTEAQTTESETETEEEKTTEKMTEKPEPVSTEDMEVPETEAVQEETDIAPPPPVYEEEYMQCPYCAQWFSAQPDGDLWNPYDRHVLDERDRIEGGQQTEQEMAQCPDCLNWYETGNIFRNHICSGRQQSN